MTIDTARLRALAEAATPGPWFYNGYSAIFAREVPDPIDGLTFDEWAEKLDDGHSAERYGACPACETDRPTGCRYAAEWYRRDNGCVAGVPAAYGDTAIGQQAGNAAYIAAADPPTMLALLDEIERLRGEGEWEYGHRYSRMDGSTYVSPVSWATFESRPPTAYRADGSPYWNYESVRRRKAGPWEPVEGDGDED